MTLPALASPQGFTAEMDAPALDVVVIGAGLAGLSAARTLRDRGRTCVVLEARDRVGGRTWTEDHGGTPIDMGGQWVGPGQPRVLELLEHYGLDVFESGLQVPLDAAGSYTLELDGEMLRFDDLAALPVPPGTQAALAAALRRVEDLAAGVDVEAPWRTPDAAALDGTTVESWLTNTVDDPVARVLLAGSLVNGLATHPSELSMLSLLFNNATAPLETMPERWRIHRGAQALSDLIAADLGDLVRLRHPVTGIAWSDSDVVVRSPAGTVAGRAAIVALPPSLAGRLGYRPALPGARDALTARFPTSSIIKVHAVYEHPFWRERGLNGWALLPQGSPLTLIGDNSPADGSRGVLMGFVSARNAVRWGARPHLERRAAVLADFARVMGEDASSPIAYAEADWSAEPFSRGCFQGYPTAGSWVQFGDVWRAPIGPLHWAGTEYTSSWYGYMEGAIVSGESVAATVANGG